MKVTRLALGNEQATHPNSIGSAVPNVGAVPVAMHNVCTAMHSSIRHAIERAMEFALSFPAIGYIFA